MSSSVTYRHLSATNSHSTLLVGTEAALREQFPETATELLHCHHVNLCGELPEEDPASELWQRINALSPERIWIVGGDGTINLVGQCALRAPHSLSCWLTPAGTANDLARSLSERYPRTATTLSEPSTPLISPKINVDLLAVKLDHNPWVRCSANMFTLGTSARNTHHVTSEIKARWGALAYLTQIWRAMADLEPFRIRLTVGRSHERKVDGILNLFVANGKFCGGGFQIAPNASVDDGLMDVLIVRRGTTAELAHLATTYLTGNHSEHQLVEHFTTNRIVIECDAPSPLTLDGESFAAQRIEIEIRSGCLPTSLVIPG